MKKQLLFFLLLSIGYSTRAQTLTFSYDASGNQDSREWICVSCSPYSPAAAVTNPIAKLAPVLIDTVAAVQAGKLALTQMKPVQPRKLTAYPNPFTETLFLNWQDAEGVRVKTVDVFTVGGMRVFHKDYSEQQADFSIGFGNLASGFYLVTVYYSDNKKEVVKVVKQ